jgi:hypothetical protein
MNVSDAARGLSARIVAAASAAERNEVGGGYASDLLSDVMANSREGDLWVTLQKHVNIVAVAQLNNLAGIVLVNGREPELPTIERAEAEGIPIVTTALQAFEVAGILYQLGVRGRRES